MLPKLLFDWGVFPLLYGYIVLDNRDYHVEQGDQVVLTTGLQKVHLSQTGVDKVAFESVHALIYFHMFAGAIWDEFVGKTKINEVHLWCAVGKDVDHNIFELYVVVGSMRGVNNPENVD